MPDFDYEDDYDDDFEDDDEDLDECEECGADCDFGEVICDDCANEEYDDDDYDDYDSELENEDF